MEGNPLFWTAIGVLGFAPYPGHVSTRTVRLFWTGVAILGVAFWAVFVLARGEWTNLRAWAGFAVGAYVLYWQYYPGAFDGEGAADDA